MLRSGRAVSERRTSQYDRPVTSNLLPVGAGTGAGERLRVESLAPNFDEERHGLYRDLIQRAIEHKDTRNLALTGAYGSGKSSVLRQISETYPSRVVELSLSTILTADDDLAPEPGENPAATTKTNRIQKEIIKQLLYRLPPSRTPRSRFRRASQPNRMRDFWVALAWGLGCYSALLALGLATRLVDAIGTPGWRQGLTYVLLATITVAIAWFARRAVQSRVVIESISAGPATVKLSSGSSSFFDQYLDEIVYFFEVSRCDIVVIEDIDRFEDSYVFDTLRALNGLLNNSKQLNRRIVFIYAIRDSVFELIGGDGADRPTRQTTDEPTRLLASQSNTGPVVDRAQAALARANRTKFFDVIIPVVPFITHDNARDLMSGAMKSDSFAISSSLIRLAARHLADMRLIHNIRNEFEVYRNRLIDAERPVPGLTDDRLFTIILFKNAHMADFEAIRLQSSPLDTLFMLWRRLVRENLAVEAAKLTELRARLSSESTASKRAAELSERLWRYVETLRSGIQGHPQSLVQVVHNGSTVTEDETATREFWTSIVAGTSLALHLNDRRGNAITLEMGAARLANALNIQLPPAEWGRVDVSEVEADIETALERVRFLHHHSWQELCSRPEFTVSLDRHTGSLSFEKHLAPLLQSRLAVDLIKGGHLTHHFALYVSIFYGEHLSADATEYIMRCVEPGEADANYPLSATDIEQILTDRGDELLQDPSIYNVDILNHLLASRPTDAAVVAGRLATWGSAERAFVDTYLAQGDRPGQLVAAMTPSWTSALSYVAGHAPVDPDLRLALFDDALVACVPSIAYDVTGGVGVFIESNYRNLRAVSRPSSENRANAAFTILRQCGVVLESVEPLDPVGRAAARRFSAYLVTEANLRLLAPGGSIALDALRRDAPEMYRHALEELPRYVLALQSSDTPAHSVDSSEYFHAVLTDAAQHYTDEALSDVIVAAHQDCRVPDLISVPSPTWPALVRTLRTDSTFSNVRAYIDEYGEVDASLAVLMTDHRAIDRTSDAPEADRSTVALAVVNARGELPDVELRIDLAVSLEVGPLPTTGVVPEPGSLVARLIATGLIADDASALSERLMVDWQTREAAIAASTRFPEFVSPDVLPVTELAAFIRSDAIDGATKKTVITRLSEFIANAQRREVQAIADALNAEGWRLHIDRIELLRSLGASNASLIKLMARKGEDLAIDDLRSLLRALGGPYAQIADPGLSRPVVPNDEAHGLILARLRGAAVVSSFSSSRINSGVLQVYLRRPPI